MRCHSLRLISRRLDSVHFARVWISAGFVMPEGAKGKPVLPGWSCSWTEPVAYAGVSIRVVVLVADRAA